MNIVLSLCNIIINEWAFLLLIPAFSGAMFGICGSQPLCYFISSNFQLSRACSLSNIFWTLGVWLGFTSVQFVCLWFSSVYFVMRSILNKDWIVLSLVGIWNVHSLLLGSVLSCPWRAFYSCSLSEYFIFIF